MSSIQNYLQQAQTASENISQEEQMNAAKEAIKEQAAAGVQSLKDKAEDLKSATGMDIGGLGLGVSGGLEKAFNFANFVKEKANKVKDGVKALADKTGFSDSAAGKALDDKVSSLIAPDSALGGFIQKAGNTAKRVQDIKNSILPPAAKPQSFEDAHDGIMKDYSNLSDEGQLAFEKAVTDKNLPNMKDPYGNWNEDSIKQHSNIMNEVKGNDQGRLRVGDNGGGGAAAPPPAAAPPAAPAAPVKTQSVEDAHDGVMDDYRNLSDEGREAFEKVVTEQDLPNMVDSDGNFNEDSVQQHSNIMNDVKGNDQGRLRVVGDDDDLRIGADGISGGGGAAAPPPPAAAPPPPAAAAPKAPDPTATPKVPDPTATPKAPDPTTTTPKAVGDTEDLAEEGEKIAAKTGEEAAERLGTEGLLGALGPVGDVLAAGSAIYGVIHSAIEKRKENEQVSEAQQNLQKLNTPVAASLRNVASVALDSSTAPSQFTNF